MHTLEFIYAAAVWVCVCVLWMSAHMWAGVSVVTLRRLWAHSSQKSKLNGSSIMRICDWDTCLCCEYVCVHVCVWERAWMYVCIQIWYTNSRCVVQGQFLQLCAPSHMCAYICVCVHMWVDVCGGHLSLPALWLMVYIGLFSHACFLVYRFMLSPIKAP